MRYPDMKKIAAIIVTLAIYPAISCAAEGAAAPEETAASQVAASPTGAPQKAAVAQKAVGRLYVMRGSVTVGQASPARASEPIYSGMLIKTGEKSAALLKFEDGQVVTMQSGTSFQVREYRYDAKRVEDSKIDFALFEGGVHFVTGLIGQKKRLAFSLLTPSATFRGDVANFVAVKADKLIYSKVLDGNVRITNSAGTASFRRGDSPVVPSPVILASEFYTRIPGGAFDELLSIPVAAPAIIEPAPSPAPAPAPLAGSASAPSPGSESAPAPAPELAAPSSEPQPALSPESASSAAPAPSPEPEPAPAPAPEPVPAPEPAPASVSLPIPAQTAPNCTCTCSCSLK
jgi:hypothetical protein